MRLQFGGYDSTPEPLPIQPVAVNADPSPPVCVPCSNQPLISIIIPAYNNWNYTAACLRSIAEARCLQKIEVIVVDDESSDETEAGIAEIEGLRYFRTEQNLGFIGSCNHGAEQAKGQYLVMLNNDTQVLDGWLDKLLDTFRLFPEAGLVGAKLIYPDGSLQECGGIVFQDGSGWNYGRGDNPERPDYMHVREVDYCSGACIMIETALFNEMGGFDNNYAPAYYEDTDLAFRIRARGLKVLVQPASIVIHHEGITSGTDTDSGVKRHQLINQEKFLERWQSELEGYPAKIEDPTNPAIVRAARDHHRRGKVLIIDATTPEPDQDSGSLRLSHLMRCFGSLGYGVTFFAENHLHAGRYTQDLQQWGVEVLYQPWLESNQAFFSQRGMEFDYVLISRHYIAANYVSLVKRFCPNAAFIFDTVDLHYLREQRLAELEDSLALRRVANQTRRSELAVIAQCDAVLVVSETEIELLATDAPEAQVHVLSNIHEVPGRKVEFSERSDLFFVGGYQHPPNVDAARWFVTKIWPKIHAELPEVSFHLIGSKAPDSVRALKGDGVIFHGYVEDLDQYLNHCRLAVAPLRYGAGVKGKVNMSMSRGQPVVATPLAIEGIHAEHGREILVAESEQAFAKEVVRLYRDEKLWNEISDAGIKNVKSHFSVEAARKSIKELLGKLEPEPG
jgi:GT2 family glycosyltransferase/glycosyltransferase involved in cell wall biosynthesis